MHSLIREVRRVAERGSELRYDPDDDDDANPPRGPSALLRIFTDAAVTAGVNARSPIDIYERACRALTEHGIVAAVLASSGEPGRYLLVAHRLGVAAPSLPLAIPTLEETARGAVFYPAGAHPLHGMLDIDEALRFPSVTARIPLGDGRHAVLSLFGADLGAEHTAAAEAFAAMLGANVTRVEAEARAREAAAGIEQRIRSRTRTLTDLAERMPSIFAARSDDEAARQAARVAADTLDCDVAAVLLCLQGRHQLLAAAQAADIAPGLLDTLGARLHADMEAVAPAHAACAAPGRPAVVQPDQLAAPPKRPERGVLTLQGQPLDVLNAPVLMGGEVCGLLALVDLSPGNNPPDRMRLLHLLASALSAALQRRADARAIGRTHLGAALEGLRDGVVLLDPGGAMLLANRRGRELFRTLSDAEGTPVPAAASLISAALGGDGRATAVLSTGQEPAEQVGVTATRVDGGDGGPLVLLALHDITDAELMRERLFQSEKMASVGQLVSGVAHELNNPLTGIMGFAQLLLMRNLEPEAHREAETIFTEAERASKIVQNLLSFARRRRPEKVRLDLNSLIVRALELWEYGHHMTGIEVRRDLADDLPLCLADPQQIQQVLLNVLTNAAQAIASAGREGVITVRTTAASGYVRTVISDNGPGVPPEHLRRVFDPFFTTKPPGEGTGLGLTITYGIIEEHNGRITVESPPGGGAVITIDLPAAAVAEEPEPPEEEVVEAAPPAHRILVIDDEPTIRNLLTGILALDHHDVETAADAAEAFEHLDAMPFDAVITDVRMPGMDGVTFYRRVAERNPSLAHRIIFISGDTVNRETRSFVEASGVPFLAKPFTVNEVREAVAAVLVDGGVGG
jgi:signal transduction histidine kinase/CheY-like chemotaxis protein